MAFPYSDWATDASGRGLLVTVGVYAKQDTTHDFTPMARSIQPATVRLGDGTRANEAVRA